VIVIGLTGHAGAGKDSVADILVRDHGFIKMSFAAPMKDMVQDLDPIVGYDVYLDCSCGGDECGPDVDEIRLSDLYAMGYDDESIKESPWFPEVRNLWQRFGTEVMRSRYEDYWIHQAMDTLMNSMAERVVFTDVRFSNESDQVYDFSNIKGNRGSVWQVSRPGLPAAYGHASEAYAGLLGEEIQIFNSATLEELAEPVKIALDFVVNDAIPGQGMLGIAMAGAADE
jgi:hypothetical protein